MKKLALLLIYILNYHNIQAQVQWAKQIYSTSTTFNEYCNTFTDGTNNYMIGNFDEELRFPNDTLYASGSNEIFISKIDANGNNLWNKTLFDPSNTTMDAEYANAIFDSTNQCIYVAGHFVNQITFPGLTTLNGNSDIFLAKMDLNGNFIWAKKAGGVGIDQTDVYVNPYGKIYLVSQSTDSCHYDSFFIGPGGAIVTYDTDGICLSAEVKYNYNLTNQNYVSIEFIEKDIVYYGEFITSSFHLDTVNFNSMGNYDAFIARADSTGKVKWVHSINSPGRETISKIHINKNHEIFLISTFSESLQFIGTNLIITGHDIGVAKLNANGNLIWVEKFNLNSTNLSSGLALKVSSDQHIFVTGYFNNTINLGSIQVIASSPRDMFIAKFDSLGNCLNLLNFSNSVGSSLTIDNADNIYVSGNFFNNVSIGPINLNMQGNNSDIFLAKFDAKTGFNTRTAPNNTLIIYANPNKGTCNITIPDDLKNSNNLTLMIYNAQGSLIQKQQIQQVENHIKLNLEAEASGMYNVSLGDGYKMYYGKIVFE
jgi:hypothetical protein